MESEIIKTLSGNGPFGSFFRDALVGAAHNEKRGTVQQPSISWQIVCNALRR